MRLHTVGERINQFRTRRPHVAANHDLGGCRFDSFDELGEPYAKGAAGVSIYLVGIRAPNVVGLDDEIEIFHFFS